jgi:hypothetical protein
MACVCLPCADALEFAQDGASGVASKPCDVVSAQFAALLDPEVSTVQRMAALRTVQDLARDKGGRAAQILGALYAVGVSHPSSAVNADAEMARLWFRRCLLASSATCPVTTLSDWAELELREGQGREAAVLAQLQAQITTLAQAQVGKPRFFERLRSRSSVANLGSGSAEGRGRNAVLGERANADLATRR